MNRQTVSRQRVAVRRMFVIDYRGDACVMARVILTEECDAQA